MNYGILITVAEKNTKVGSWPTATNARSLQAGIKYIVYAGPRQPCVKPDSNQVIKD